MAHAIIPNTGAMTDFIGAFDVPSKLTDKIYRCRFSHMWNAIATRHADTIDTKFWVDGQTTVVGLAHLAFAAFRERTGRSLTDREASYVAAEYLRERLQEEDEHETYNVPQSDVERIITRLGIN
ncbi:MAG TPA: hypothetical protein VFO34_16190 [Candidatus Acidoferrales bacterium]|nr:hypothetical protein [Candidatus Acidoferrales bacterium]